MKEWIPFETVLKNGVILTKEKRYIKIIKVQPINFNLKSDLEKQAILNSYKVFLQTCSFPFQILIQSKKQQLFKNISQIKKQENNHLEKIKIKYIHFLEQLNEKNQSTFKNFYFIIDSEDKKEKSESSIFQELQEKFLKIKEGLSRCGNIIQECSEEETVQIIHSFFI